VATTKWVYSFEEADGGNKDLFGGKGGNLAAMTALGLPIRPDSPSRPRPVRRISQAAER
jgi:hypothetical protein